MTPNELKEKRIKFLDDTIEHFHAHNRGMEKLSGNCSYVAGCAIGRHIPKSLADELDCMCGDTSTSVSNIVIFEKLPPDMRELGKEFLSHIQGLHDYNRFWNTHTIDGELSEQGENKVKQIREYIENDLYD